MTSLIEMLELSNFCHMTTFTILFELRDKFCWRRNGTKGRNADIIKIAIMFIKANFKDSTISKEIKIMHAKAIPFCISRYEKIADFLAKKC